MSLGGSMRKITEFITITELAPLLDITRPTLYKYVVDYEAGDYRNIKYDIVVIFDYITKEAKNKVDIINFIKAQNSESDSPLIKEIKALLKSDTAFKELLTFLVEHIRKYDEALITLKEGEIKHE